MTWVYILFVVALMGAVLVWVARRQQKHAGNTTAEQGRLDAIRRAPDNDGPGGGGHGI